MCQLKRDDVCTALWPWLAPVVPVVIEPPVPVSDSPLPIPAVIRAALLNLRPEPLDAILDPDLVGLLELSRTGVPHARSTCSQVVRLAPPAHAHDAFASVNLAHVPHGLRITRCLLGRDPFASDLDPHVCRTASTSPRSSCSLAGAAEFSVSSARQPRLPSFQIQGASCSWCSRPRVAVQ